MFDQTEGVGMRTEALTGGSSRHTEKLVSKFDKMLNRSGGALVDRFGEELSAVMRQEMLDEYRRLIPDVPYIGGWRNVYSSDMSASAWALAMYRVVVRHGGSLEDAGELLQQVVRAEIERVPQAVRSLMVSYRFSSLRWQLLQRAARRSQARRYPGDWVFETVEGDGKSFDFGVDMTECGIVKFLHAQGADELVPYLCEFDYIAAEAMGVGLQRSKTLAWGCDRCDFRLTKDGGTSAPWPSRFIERNCGERQTEEETAAS